MKAIESYNNICVSLDMAKNHLDRFTEQRKYWVGVLDSRKPKDIQAQSYSDMPKGSRNDTPLPEIIEIIEEIDSHILLQESNYNYYNSLKKESEQYLSKLEGIEAEVYRLHVIKGLPLKEVADKLFRDYQYIKNISSKIRKECY